MDNAENSQIINNNLVKIMSKMVGFFQGQSQPDIMQNDMIMNQIMEIQQTI